jgi:hypothetical protein
MTISSNGYQNRSSLDSNTEPVDMDDNCDVAVRSDVDDTFDAQPDLPDAVSGMVDVNDMVLGEGRLKKRP